MPSPWSSWKAGVMVVTAVAGLALAAVGYNAPRLPTSLAASVASVGPAGTAAKDPAPAHAGASAGSTGSKSTSGGQTAASTSTAGGTSAASKSTSGGQAATSTSTAGGTSTTAKGATASAGATTAAKSSGGTTTGTAATTSAKTGGTASGSATASASAAPAKGPLLSQTQYAQFAYQIYPGSPSAAAQRALSGFQVSFKSLGNGKEQVTITAGGQSQNASFNASDKLYIVETRVSDDGFGQDTNFGDDGFILTNTEGYLVGQ